MTAKQTITVTGARQNNLKSVNLTLESGRFIALTGPSGSGKSSLAFDTLYAEGQRRYMETFSPYARQFLDRCERPQVDRIDGVPPAIAIRQCNAVRTSRSTIGSMTEINDLIRLLFANNSELFCGNCAEKISDRSLPEICADIRNHAGEADPKVVITFTVTAGNSLEKQTVADALSYRGFTKIVSETTEGESTRFEVAADRFRLSKADDLRVSDALKTAFEHTDGVVCARLTFDDGTESVRKYAKGMTCAYCGQKHDKPGRGIFSFNSPIGACPDCKGFGRTAMIDMNLVIPDQSLSLKDRCIRAWQGAVYGRCHTEMLEHAIKDGIPTDVPFRDLTEAQRDWVINGSRSFRSFKRDWYGVNRFFRALEEDSYKMHVRVFLSKYKGYFTCKTCNGARIRTPGLLWRLGNNEQADECAGNGRYKRFVPNGVSSHYAETVDTLPGFNIHDLMSMPVKNLVVFFDRLAKDNTDKAAAEVIERINTRLGYLMRVGLGYMTLGRQSRTLSGGELQRVNLTTALGVNLTDSLFVLDEPSVGLHPRDIGRVNGLIRNLSDAGNTVVVVEHDPQVLTAADRLIEMGPGSGVEGGSIVYSGSPEKISGADTVTGRYFAQQRSVEPASDERAADIAGAKKLTIRGACENNLRNVDLSIPIGFMTCVTGVSGSGKSTLVLDTLVPAVKRHLGETTETCGKHSSVENGYAFDNVYHVDQEPLTKNIRSCPAAYVDILPRIRTIFASSEEAKAKNFSTSHFSFNAGPGRCPYCEGAGYELVEMQFMSDVLLTCPHCHGRRFNDEVLRLKPKLNIAGERFSIADVLDMTVDRALEVFRGYSVLPETLQVMSDLGLGYLKLGQPTSTLSGGEAQRLKLAGLFIETTAKKKRVKASNLYVLDEPTSEMHFDDVEKLLAMLRKLVGMGNTVVLVEHNLDVIKSSDWIVEMGPEGGDEGGEIVFEGTVRDLLASQCHTGRALAGYLEPARSTPAAEKPAKNPGRSLQSVWKRAREGDIGIFGACENNLKNVDTVIPKKKMTVVTGVSGSGKSSLAFDIVFREGQRRYLESINAYARSLVQPDANPDVQDIVNISPTVAIEQRTSRGGYKSTVATLTEVMYYLRLIYSKLGKQYCPDCNRLARATPPGQIIADLVKKFPNTCVTLTRELVRNRKGNHVDICTEALKKYGAIIADGTLVTGTMAPKLHRYSEHTIEAVIGSLQTDKGPDATLTEILEDIAKNHEKDLVFAYSDAGCTTRIAEYSFVLACPQCGRGFSEPDPKLFSYNSRAGWCPSCFGTGVYIPEFDAEQSGEENKWLDNGKDSKPCPACRGGRLNPVARAVRFMDKSICDITAMNVARSLEFFRSLKLEGRDEVIAGDAVKEIVSKLEFLQDIGLYYITLDRSAPSLSGGEAQRIRLASQLGNNLQGVCYVLDEPTIGLHARDNGKLIEALKKLRDKGNTVLVVEHDEDTIREADHIIDIGPAAGVRGGTVVAQGSLKTVCKKPESATARMLNRGAVVPEKRRTLDPQRVLHIAGAADNNLQDLSLDIPLGGLVVLTGVSGSGKSTLAKNHLAKLLSAALAAEKDSAESGKSSISGCSMVGKMLEVDQSPIGKTSRSCPSTYIGMHTPIRGIYANTDGAKAAGLTASHFSFNKSGMCTVCGGIGAITTEMNFLPNVRTVCSACAGQRFSPEVLAVKWHDKSIGDVLDMNAEEALELFANSPKIAKMLRLVIEVGLGYLKLGQQSSTLSGGEAQRLKLVTELAKNGARPGKTPVLNKKTFYILDEPTVGLHMSDVERLLGVMHRLVDTGNTVLVIEHNLDVIAQADHVIDLGPEGGENGGRIVGTGTPEQIAELDTATGRELRKYIDRARSGKSNQ